jgi:hypothetical protein
MDITLFLESCLVIKKTSSNALFKFGEFFEKFPINPLLKSHAHFFGCHLVEFHQKQITNCDLLANVWNNFAPNKQKKNVEHKYNGFFLAKYYWSVFISKFKFENIFLLDNNVFNFNFMR